MKKKKIYKIKYTKKNILFFLAYSLLIFYRILKSSALGINDHGITWIIVAIIFVAHFITMKVKLSRIVISGAMLIIVSIYTLNTSDPIVPVVALAIIASKNIEFESIVKQSFLIMVPLVIIIVLMALTGIIPNTVSAYKTIANHSVACHSIGFNHFSALPTYYCFMFLEYWYLNRNKFSVVKIIAWLLGGCIIYGYCAERLRFYMLFIIALLIVLAPIFSNRFYKTKLVIMTVIFPILAFITLALGFYYKPSNSVMYALNMALNNRLYFEHYSFEHYDITLFGQNIVMGENALSNLTDSYFYIDSAYVYILFSYGILIAIGLIIAYTYGARKSAKVNNYAAMVCFLVIAIDSMVGNQMLSIWSMPILFFPFCINKQNRLVQTNKEIIDLFFEGT